MCFFYHEYCYYYRYLSGDDNDDNDNNDNDNGNNSNRNDNSIQSTNGLLVIYYPMKHQKEREFSMPLNR